MSVKTYDANGQSLKTGGIDLTTQDPKKIAQMNRQTIQQQGTSLDEQNRQQAAQAEAAKGQTQDYLGNIMNPMAQGQGGYNANETSQIEMTPEQKQQMVTSAGISAGTGTAAAVGAADRAAAAAGGNPLALAAYRARAAQTEGGQAGDAMTQARVAAQQAGATEAENVGQTRLGQQSQGLNYYQGLQGQQNQNAQGAYGRQQQGYGTESSGINSAAGTSQSASQNPTTFDKVMGGVSGALSFLDEGDMATGQTPAVVGENGPEKVVDLSGSSYMDDGGFGFDQDAANEGTAPVSAYGFDQDAANEGTAPATAATPVGPTGTSAPQSWWRKLQTRVQPAPAAIPQGMPQQGQPAPQQSASMQSAKTIGQGVGKLASLFLDDGGMPQGRGGVFTKPTQVMLGKNEAVVPLSYRPQAKTRPSMAALPAARVRQPYGGASAGH